MLFVEETAVTEQAVAGTDTDMAVLIRRSLETVGRTADTAVVAFTDGCPGLQSILTEAGITKPPIADWFHIAMRPQHARQAASGLSTDQPHRVRAKTAIIAEVERLHWRIWNGKATDSQLTPASDRMILDTLSLNHLRELAGRLPLARSLPIALGCLERAAGELTAL